MPAQMAACLFHGFKESLQLLPVSYANIISLLEKKSDLYIVFVGGEMPQERAKYADAFF